MRHFLSDSEMAQLSASAINTSQYIADYMHDLVGLIDDKDDAILDSACGIGFPSMELWAAGFSNITICDGDPSSLELLRSKLADFRIEVNSIVSTWENLSQLGEAQFDLILNLGNSFVYMDGWRSDIDEYESVSASFNHIEDRCVHILREFRHVLKTGGKAVIGLAKHYDRSTVDGAYANPLTCTIQSGTIGGIELPLEWTGVYDWSKRTHLWKTHVETEAYIGTAIRMAYLLTKGELALFMRSAGFREVRVIETENARDNFIVGMK